MKVEFYRHNLGAGEAAKVAGVLQSLFLTTGPVTARFEEDFAAYTGLPHVVALNSCTAALHLSLLALGVGPGDEVITTPMTFIATATAILHTGARPVFVDVEEDTGLMEVEGVKRAITPRTRAILPVHLYGTLVDMPRLRELADRHRLAIVEDCAHCLEGERDGVRPGHLGDLACYSFYATKSLTCGEGGAVATRNSEWAEKIRLLRLHGMSRDAASRYHGTYQHWEMLAEGWKYNLHDLSSALLVIQLPRIQDYWERRRELCRRYDEGFRDRKGLRIPSVKGEGARHLYTLWVAPERRDALLRWLQESGIGVAVNYRALPRLAFFRSRDFGRPEDFPRADRIGESTVTLPLYPGLREDEMAHIIARVNAFLEV